MADDISASYQMRLPLLQQLRDNLERETKEALLQLKHIDRVSFRVKDPKSFTKKAEDRRTTPPYTNPLVEIEDQVAGRIIVFFMRDLDAVLKRMEGTFNMVE